MTPSQHALHIRDLEFDLYKAEHGLALPYSAEDVAHYRRLLAEARRSAAAPDLLAALEQCADLLWQYGGDQSSDDGWKTEELREACLNARAAIAKAEGTS